MEGERQKNWAREVAENARKAIEEMQVAGLTADTASASAPTAGLSREEILAEVLKVSKDIRRKVEEPYRKVLRENGFDEDRDMIFISTLWADAEGFRESRVPLSLRDRVKFTPSLVVPIMLVRVPGMPLGFQKEKNDA